jgi:hypothetical protein
MEKISGAGSGVVDVAYKAMNGEIRVMPWTDVDPLAVADGRPWREFPWYLGQRHYSGMYWSATEVKLVGYESLLELSRLLMADFDRSSKRIVSQPFQIKARIEGEGIVGSQRTWRNSQLCDVKMADPPQRLGAVRHRRGPRCAGGRSPCRARFRAATQRSRQAPSKLTPLREYATSACGKVGVAKLFSSSRSRQRCSDSGMRNRVRLGAAAPAVPVSPARIEAPVNAPFTNSTPSAKPVAQCALSGAVREGFRTSSRGLGQSRRFLVRGRCCAVGWRCRGPAGSAPRTSLRPAA